ncbi:hypothetical protein ANCDUO_19116 [Ancylostoma duodenale]|uniref:Cytochrome P450 n=1 Tax=Ancylostoma duodenale TaxID=51022 RepID=A0A0C2CM35_9BILA|nr:hypothetical protein ANCDUO_19116 [Ancylostoma duodenale]
MSLSVLYNLLRVSAYKRGQTNSGLIEDALATGGVRHHFFGRLHMMDFHRIHEVFAEFSKQYGNVFTVWLPKPYVVIMDFENIKEAFLKKGDYMGDNWKVQRRVSLHILRDFGMGKNLMEEQVLLSAQEFLAHLSTINNKDEMSLSLPIQVFVANIINRTLFGFGYEYNNCDRLVEGVEAVNSTFIDIRYVL